MKRYATLLLICSFLPQVLSAQNFLNTQLPRGERAFIASKIYSMLQLYFSGWKAVPDLDLDIAYRNYLEKALAADDRREFDLATLEFVARMRNGHTLFSDSWLRQNYGQGLGFYARPLDGKWVVVESAMPSIRPGDVLSKINDTETEAFFRQEQKYISASSETAQLHNLFFFPYLFPEQFTLTLGDGSKVAVDRAKNKFAAVTPANDEGRWLKPGDVAYIRLPSFAIPSVEGSALALVVKFRMAKTLIIDVRNNAGGLPQERLIQALVDSTYSGWKESTPVHISLFDYFSQVYKGEQPKESSEMNDFERGYISAFSDLFNGSQLSWGGGRISPEKPIFHGRLIFLMDGGCASACEDLLEPFANNHRATLIGETTEGTAGPAFMYDFHNGMILGIAVKRRYFPNGAEFEGVGIKPDIEIHSSIDDLKKGKDVVLDKALELTGK